MIKELQQQVVQTYTVLANTMSDDVESGLSPQDVPFYSNMSSDFLQDLPEKKRPAKRRPEPKIVERPAEEDLRPLTLEEQEVLTETINDLPADHLHGVIQIIREAAKLTGDEDEIDLEIDQLDTGTQRKLLRYVSKVRLTFLHTLLEMILYYLLTFSFVVPLVCQATQEAKGKGHKEEKGYICCAIKKKRKATPCKETCSRKTQGRPELIICNWW